MNKVSALLGSLIIFEMLAVAGPLGAQQWPEREISLVTSIPAFLPWETPNPQLAMVQAISADLERKLKTQVIIDLKPGGGGTMAGNRLSEAKKDGYVLGLLEADPAISRVIQGYTPYGWDEMDPVALAWREIKALVVPADKSWESLTNRPQIDGNPRLATLGTTPVSGGTAMAMEAALRSGFRWNLTVVEKLDPAILLQGKAEAMVVPLGGLNTHPQADDFKIILVFTENTDLPCAWGHPTLADLGLKVTADPPAAFYLPSKVNVSARRIFHGALKEIKAAEAGMLESACLEKLDQTFDDLPGFMDEQYHLQAEMLKKLGLAPDISGLENNDGR